MIEVNLLPGSHKQGRKKRRASRGIALPSGLTGDRWVTGAAVMVLVALVGIAWMHLAVAGEAEELALEIEAAEQESIRFAGLIDRTEALQARRDSIARRVSVIQEIDGSRYVWPHIMDELARALPDYTWLNRIQQVTAGEPIIIRIEGRAGTYFALTALMEALEDSPFLTGTELISADQVALDGSVGMERRVYRFVLEAQYRSPPSGMLRTEPLFGGSVNPDVGEEG